VAIGLDTNILCYALDNRYPEHEKVKNLLITLSPENQVALNPTVIHETYHTLVFYSKWTPKEAAKRLTGLLRHPYIEFYNQTRKTSLIALNLSVTHNLDGRDALLTANNIANKILILFTHDKTLLKLQKITWKSTNLTFKDPLTSKASSALS
jgi:predicted nucleic acid-binding protein